jgi:ATP-binding cassette, subfamily B, bacterial CvaB/MchF/RaxB
MQVHYQSERSECGLVCIAMLASEHGLEFDLASLRARYPVSLKGSTLKGLVDIAGELNLETRALRCEVDDLAQLRLPAILHWRMDHFVVLVKCGGGKFVLNDPAIGRITVSAMELSENFTGVAMEVWPGATFQKKDQRNRLKLSSVIPRTASLNRALLSLFVFAFGIELMVLVLPIIQQLVIDNALVTADTALLNLLVMAIGIFLFGQAAVAAIQGLAKRNLSSSLSMIVPSHVFRHMGALPASWFEKRAAADVVNRFDSANSIHQTLTSSIVTAGIDGLVAITALAVMTAYSPFLTAIVFTAFLAYGLLRVIWYNSYSQKSQGMLVQTAKVQSLLWETMRGIVTIKMFNGLRQRHGQYLSTLSQYVRLQNGIATANTAFAFGHDILFAAERIAIVYLGAKAVLAQEFSVGMLIAFLSFRENFVGKGTSLINTAIEFRMLGIHLDRLSDILLTPKENTTKLPFLGDREISGEIEVRRVSYRYGQNEVDVLKDCSLRVKPGEILAIVGPSGAGKSTLFKLLTGQAEPRTGEILIDGLSVASIGLERLRDLIAVVRQDDMLFSGTITENIAFLEEAPDHDRVRQSAEKARIHDEIQAMPMGYNTLIGSMGTGLSGGQSQRLMLARALYRKPRILLLDEATSNLDVDNERAVSLTLRDLGVTQIVIAHRPETIAKADRVIDIREINRRTGDKVVPFEKPKEVVAS